MTTIIFCDFDGTITAVETFVGMLQEFTPQLASEILPQIHTKQITLKQGARKILESIPSSLFKNA